MCLGSSMLLYRNAAGFRSTIRPVPHGRAYSRSVRRNHLNSTTTGPPCPNKTPKFPFSRFSVSSVPPCLSLPRSEQLLQHLIHRHLYAREDRRISLGVFAALRLAELH